MVYYRFDGTFDGLLTAVFQAFERHETPDRLIAPDGIVPLFYDVLHEVETDEKKARRVWLKLGKTLSRASLSGLTTAFLTDNPEFPDMAFRYICRAVTSGGSIENDFSDPAVLSVLKECRRVRGEAHRLLQFVRFQKAADGTYFAMVEPLFDVLPMAVSHFCDRFNDQRFILYDRARDYGYYYDGEEVKRTSIDTDSSYMNTGRLTDEMMDADERLFQRLWRTYFKATAIQQRMNPRKQRQDMPERYWKYLTEMNGCD